MIKYTIVIKHAIAFAAVLIAQTASGQGSDYSTKKSAVLGGQEYSIDFGAAIDFKLVNPKFKDFQIIDRNKLDDWSHIPHEINGWYYDANGEQVYEETAPHPTVFRTLPAYDTEQLSSEIWKNFTNKEKRLLKTGELVLECCNTIDENGLILEIKRISAYPSDIAARISRKSYGRIVKTISQDVVYEDFGVMKYLGIRYYYGDYYSGNIMKIKIDDGKVEISGYGRNIYDMGPAALSSLLNPQYTFKHVDIQKLIEQKKKEKVTPNDGGAQVDDNP